MHMDSHAIHMNTCAHAKIFFFLENWFKSEWCCHMPCVSFGQWPHILLEGSSNGKAKPTSYLKICTRWQNVSGDFVFRPWWPWRLVLDPEGSGSGGSGGLYWEGWLPHGHVWAIAEGLNRIFCSQQKESPFQRRAANVTYRVLWPKRHRTNSGFSTECLTHPPIHPSSHSPIPLSKFWESISWVRCSKINPLIKHWTRHYTINKASIYYGPFERHPQTHSYIFFQEEKKCLHCVRALTEWKLTGVFSFTRKPWQR